MYSLSLGDILGVAESVGEKHFGWFLYRDILEGRFTFLRELKLDPLHFEEPMYGLCNPFISHHSLFFLILLLFFLVLCCLGWILKATCLFVEI